MSSDNVAISVRGLSKAYTIAGDNDRPSTLAETVLQRLRNPLRRAPRETFWALKDVSFDVRKGDVVGVVGRNGAGKSSLLKIISRITEPTTGEIDLYGRVGSLLEVGTGFHPELSGRENIFLNGAILGMSKAEIRRQFDAIVDFAGVAKFLDTPVKRYSSGMYVRLAFAVAAHLNPEILIVDEVLAVGDTEFQNKCLGKMKDVASGGRTVLYVSHNLPAVAALCNVGILLERGQLVAVGSADEIVNRYASGHDRAGGSRFVRSGGSGELQVSSFEPERPTFEPGETKLFRYRLRAQAREAGNAWLSLHVRNQSHELLLQCDSRLENFWVPPGEDFEGTFELTSPWLKPGDYYCEIFVSRPQTLLDHIEQCGHFTVSEELPYVNAASECGTEKGYVFADFHWSGQRSMPPGP